MAPAALTTFFTGGTDLFPVQRFPQWRFHGVEKEVTAAVIKMGFTIKERTLDGGPAAETLQSDVV